MKQLLIFALFLALLASLSVRAGSPGLPDSTQPNLTLLMIGQSNMDGTGGPSQPLLLPGAREEHVAWCFYKDRQWALLQDPVSGGEAYYPEFANVGAGGSVAPGIARRLMPTVGNIAFIPSAKGGSAIGSWLFRPTGRLSLLDKAVDQVRASGRNPDLALWWQGETNARSDVNTPASSYKFSLGKIAQRVFDEFGCPLMVAVMHTSDPVQYANQGVIQQAQRESWTEIPHVVQGPDLSSIQTMPQDHVHMKVPARIDLAASRFAEAIKPWWQAQQ